MNIINVNGSEISKLRDAEAASHLVDLLHKESLIDPVKFNASNIVFVFNYEDTGTQEEFEAREYINGCLRSMNLLDLLSLGDLHSNFIKNELEFDIEWHKERALRKRYSDAKNNKLFGSVTHDAVINHVYLGAIMKYDET